MYATKPASFSTLESMSFLGARDRDRLKRKLVVRVPSECHFSHIIFRLPPEHAAAL